MGGSSSKDSPLIPLAASAQAITEIRQNMVHFAGWPNPNEMPPYDVKFTLFYDKTGIHRMTLYNGLTFMVICDDPSKQKWKSVANGKDIHISRGSINSCNGATLTMSLTVIYNNTKYQHIDFTAAPHKFPEHFKRSPTSPVHVSNSYITHVLVPAQYPLPRPVYPQAFPPIAQPYYCQPRPASLNFI